MVSAEGKAKTAEEREKEKEKVKKKIKKGTKKWKKTKKERQKERIFCIFISHSLCISKRKIKKEEKHQVKLKQKGRKTDSGKGEK